MKSEGKSLVFIQNVTTSYAWTQNKKFSIPWETVMGFYQKGMAGRCSTMVSSIYFRNTVGAKTISERPIAEWIKTLICGYGREK